jgi:GGDEF domain-containing protein
MTAYSFPSLFGILGISLLLAIHLLAVAGRWRRAQWQRRTRAVAGAEKLPDQQEIRKAGAAGRASDFLSRQLRRAYYVIAFVASIILLALPRLPVSPQARLVLWIGLTALTFGSALILVTYWQGWDEDLDRLLRKRLIEAEEREVERKGLPVRDAESGAFTLEFWLHSLETLFGRSFRRSAPISCIVFEVLGVEELGRLPPGTAAPEVFGAIVRCINSNLRAYDIVCRSREARFAVALIRCPSRFIDRVANRVAGNLTHLVLTGVNEAHGVHLGLRWRGATLPDDALTPIQLLHVAELKLNQVDERAPAWRA